MRRSERTDYGGRPSGKGSSWLSRAGAIRSRSITSYTRSFGEGVQDRGRLAKGGRFGFTIDEVEDYLNRGRQS